MGRSFRPVREDWGPSTDCFIGSENLAMMLESLAYDAEINRESLDYGQDISMLWIEDGAKFLNLLESDRFTVEAAKKALADILPLPGEETDEDWEALVGNVKGLVPAWRRSIGGDGELRFYIDTQ